MLYAAAIRITWRAKLLCSRRGSDVIRVIVAGQLPQAEHNAMLHLFSGMTEVVGYGASHYRRRSAESSTLLDQLVLGYRGEGIAMPYTMKDFKRDYMLEHFKELTAEERRKALQKLPPEERLGGLSPEERLEGLSPQEIEAYLKKLQADRPPQPPKPRRKR